MRAYRNYLSLDKNIKFLAFGIFANSLGAFIVPMLSLILTNAMGYSASESGLIISVASILYIPGSLVAGHLADTFGKKEVLTVLQLSVVILWAVCGLIPLPPMVFIAFISMGYFFIGGINPVINGLISDIAKPEDRRNAFSLVYLAYNFGSTIGPTIAGLLFIYSYKLLFLVDGLTTFISAMVILFFTTIVKVSNKESNQESIKNVSVSTFSVLKNNPRLLRFGFANFFIVFAYAQVLFLLPLYLDSILNGNGSTTYGLLLSINGIVVIFSTPLINQLTDRFKPTTNVMFSGLIYCFAMLLVPISPAFLWLSVVIVFWTFGEILFSANANTYIAEHAPDTHRARINSIIPLIYGSAFNISPILMGLLLMSFSFEFLWYFSSASAVLGVLIVKGLK